ncbi:MAG TPA: tRNA lysidine(34) synthetase TilS [Rhodocyclaceae bacterium]|jgi:tRNA(Ile)-lysidine synthase|nr:tRNA lysidine(34) synthetase TilS [Rhodocyclaceae bacterium]
MASSRNKLSTDSLTQALNECLRKTLTPGKRIAIAFSGGLDSSVLLHLAARHGAGVQGLSAIHVNHGLSPHAEAWADFCRARCAEFNIPFALAKVTVPQDAPEGLEAAARRLRYEVFSALDVDHVLLAHHANDQAETLLFNLMRGAGVLGAAGIPATSTGGRYLRPLLGSARNELEAYASAHELHWIEDESNHDVDFSRNFIRHEVLPILASRFPAAALNLARSADYFSEAQEMLDEMARFDLGGVANFPVPIVQLTQMSEARARNALRYLISAHGLQAPNGKRLSEALRQFLEAGPDKHPSLDLPAYRLYRSRGMVLLETAYS